MTAGPPEPGQADPPPSRGAALFVRFGEASDLPAIAAIQSACPEAASWPVEDYLQYDLRVAVVGSRVAGFLVARVLAETEAEILNLAVDPSMRRLGVAKALARSLLNGYSGPVFLEVRARNKGARQFYESIGFKEVSVRKEYYEAPSDAAIVMKYHSC